MVAIVDEYFGTAYGLTQAFVNLGSMFFNWYVGTLMKDHINHTIIFWSGSCGVAFLISVVWNIVDATTGGLANSPANFDEEDEDEDESKTLLINSPPTYGS